MPLEKRTPEWAVSEGVNSSPCATGSARYGARSYKFKKLKPDCKDSEGL